MMNWDTAIAISEITSAIAVVVTLLYLSRQIKENSRQLRLTSSTDLSALMNQAFDPIYNNEQNGELWIMGLNDPDSLTKVQLESLGH